MYETSGLLGGIHACHTSSHQRRAVSSSKEYHAAVLYAVCPASRRASLALLAALVGPWEMRDGNDEEADEKY
jgi:hypothetical protein